MFALCFKEMGEVEKPFSCPEQDCGMSFTNEDHLQVHRRRHEIQLSINNCGNLQPTSSLVKHTGFLIDQTPTPTRFLKHCDEVNLFQDVNLNLNPFDLEFRKASQYRSQLSISENHGLSGSLETPRILPPVDSDETISSTSRDDIHLSTSNSLHQSSILSISTSESNINGLSSHLNSPSIIKLETEHDRKESRKRLTLNVSTASEAGQSSSVISTPTPVITAGPSVSQSLGAVSCSTPTLNTPNILSTSIPHITLNGVGLGLSDLNTPGLSPTYHLSSTPTSVVQHSSDQSSFMQDQCGMRTTQAALVGHNSKVYSVSALNNAGLSTVPPSPSATVLQLVLRLPNGQAIPVEIPATPVVSSLTSNVAEVSAVPSIAPAYQTTAYTSVISNPTPSLAKMRLKQALASCNTAARPGVNKHSRATTADRIAEMTRNRNLSGTSSNGGDMQDDSSSSCSSAASNANNNTKGQRRRRSSNPDDNPEEKRKKFLERNRAAAVRCREKKKRFVETMAAKSDELGNVNQRLQSEVSSLRSEVAALKSLLLRHKNCPVTLAMQNGEEPEELLEGSPHPFGTFKVHQHSDVKTELSSFKNSVSVPSSASHVLSISNVRTLQMSNVSSKESQLPPKCGATSIRPIISVGQKSRSSNRTNKFRKRSLSLSSIPFPSGSVVPTLSSTDEIQDNSHVLYSCDGMVKPSWIYLPVTNSVSSTSCILSGKQPQQPIQANFFRSLKTESLFPSSTPSCGIPGQNNRKLFIPNYVQFPSSLQYPEKIAKNDSSLPINLPVNSRLLNTSLSSLGKNDHQHALIRTPNSVQEYAHKSKEFSTSQMSPPINSPTKVIIGNYFYAK